MHTNKKCIVLYHTFWKRGTNLVSGVPVFILRKKIINTVQLIPMNHTYYLRPKRKQCELKPSLVGVTSSKPHQGSPFSIIGLFLNALSKMLDQEIVYK
jgi:hypothetical protein